jgi:hypothetical protein
MKKVFKISKVGYNRENGVRSRKMTEYFEEIEDIRITGKIKHDLKETIVVVICAVAGGCDSWEVIEDFARVKLDWYREVMHLRLENGIPSHDTMQRIFGMIKPE